MSFVTNSDVVFDMRDAIMSADVSTMLSPISGNLAIGENDPLTALWLHYISGNGGDYNLTGPQIVQIVKDYGEINDSVTALKSACASVEFWNRPIVLKAQTSGASAAPTRSWPAALNIFTYTLTSTCSCQAPKVLDLTIDIYDVFDFDIRQNPGFKDYVRNFVTGFVNYPEMRGLSCGWNAFDVVSTLTKRLMAN